MCMNLKPEMRNPLENKRLAGAGFPIFEQM